MKKDKIISNKARCIHCGDIIESKFTHDFNECSCRTIFVDGGKEYLRRGFKNSPSDFEDLSEVIKVEVDE